MRRYKHKFWNVAPRYTPGSPAMVDETIARKVSEEEKYFHKIALEGSWGENEKRKAEKQGLDFIVYRMSETSKGWEVFDLITGKDHFWPFVAECHECKSKKVTCRSGRLTAHYGKYGSTGKNYECRATDVYVGKEIRV